MRLIFVLLQRPADSENYLFLNSESRVEFHCIWSGQYFKTVMHLKWSREYRKESVKSKSQFDV